MVNEVFGTFGEVLTETQKKRGVLIHAFQQIQEEHNYIPEEELHKLSKDLEIPLSDVYSTATFYKQFYFTPRGKKIVRVCTGTACHVRGASKVLDKIKEEPKYYFAFGNSIHHAMEFLYAVKAPPFPGIDELLEAFKKDWGLKSYLEKGYKDPLRADADYQKGLAMLRNYYSHHQGKFKLPFLLEYSTDVEVDGLLVRIIADKIEYQGKGEIVLVD